MMSSFERSWPESGGERCFVGAGASPEDESFVPTALDGHRGDDPVEPEEDEAALFGEVAAEAYAAGYGHGRAQLPWQQAEGLERAMAGFESAAAQLAELRRRYLRAHRAEVVSLARAMAERLVRGTLQQDPRVLVELVERAIEVLPESPRMALRLSPEDAAVLEQGASERLAQLLEAGALALCVDEALGTGDFALDSERAEVDGRLSALLDRLVEEMDEALDTPEARS